MGLNELTLRLDKVPEWPEESEWVCSAGPVFGSKVNNRAERSSQTKVFRSERPHEVLVFFL